ncbi:MAG TPA: BadF/BadG/BcrA/BcrD ATPase family protein [Vicinamibacterales bacterium]|jgi:activator of 2-hydroxyglutaryl-CoA dehydratase/predicted nucleotide-binding protein (sugar kinase/HSP70/actin superfamily)|nr:BadF/BadG/BcrA/BcrD ATPase family protein [Vicinamibacterales bacterium]
MSARWLLGVDFGSTALKAVLVDTTTDSIAWRRYERHESLFGEKLLAWLRALEQDHGIAPANCRVFATGAAAGALAPAIGARFVQEVHAISLVVEQKHPEAETVIELGGQDAKIVLFKDDGTGRRKKVPSMNEKCAGGTGAVIDKIAAKVGIAPDDLGNQTYDGIKVHSIAGKCGVFAETDITGLLKQGIPARELIASLFDAIVLQNLSVLTRGYTLMPRVLLLGGPNAFITGLRQAWRQRICDMWKDRGVALPAALSPDDLVAAPPLAEYYGAMGAVEFGRLESLDVGRYAGSDLLVSAIHSEREQNRGRSALPGLVSSERERDDFIQRYAPPPYVPPHFEAGKRVPAFLGLDAGSTSTKGVLLGNDGAVLAKAYRLSLGNPIEDAIEIIARLRTQVEHDGAILEIAGAGTTGYAKDILRDVLGADVAIAETVAHTESAKREYHDPHVIVDVGGQDIKLIFLKDGRVKDFRLNTQCSAGNGYFLQATAESFGIRVEDFAALAFGARAMPLFGYGCAVFLQSDIVGFQRLGWTRQEILAGLAAVLPKNVFLYVARVPDLTRLGTRFILQGGTQRNLAAVKAQVDFIRASFARAGVEPEILVHRHAGEAGGIGAALEAMRVLAARPSGRTTFIGLDAVRRITYTTTRGEETRCRFCTNECLRVFIDVSTGDGHARRVIVATCEKGAVEDVRSLRAVKSDLDRVAADNPDFVHTVGREVWKPRRPALVADAASPGCRGAFRGRPRQRRASLRVGIPRVLNMYSYAPLFSAYLESLGVRADHIVYSDFTSAELYRSGSSRGSIDPCYPSKVAIAHVHNLLGVKHARAKLDCIFFPMFDVLDSPLVATCGQNACPTVAATPRTVWAAFTKESDLFAEAGVEYLDPLVNLANRRLFALQMFDTWEPMLGLSRAENERAVAEGFRALDAFWSDLRRRARAVLDRITREDRIGIVVLGRPYHHDPGVNHGILQELQKRGYPVFSQMILPRDEDLLERLFGDDIRDGVISHPLDISDVWKHTTSENTNQKIWAAKFVARHPNLVALEFSSFKCGHDAPVYAVIEEIVESAGRPYLAFKDLDENRAAGAIKLRVETIDYFLRRYREESTPTWRTLREIEEQLEAVS